MVGQFYYEQTPPESFVAKPEYFVNEKSAFSTGARVLLSIHRSLKFRRASNFSEIGDICSQAKDYKRPNNERGGHWGYPIPQYRKKNW